MEEIITYLGQEGPGYSILIHSSTVSYAYKSANCPPHGAASTGFSALEKRLFVAVPKKALVHVYVPGKEAPVQKIPVPEQLLALALSHTTNGMPWLLAAGSVSGKLYVWELSSGVLLYSKAAHYQAVTKLQFSKNNAFLVTCSEDARTLVYSVPELVDVFGRTASETKPLALSHHTRPVTDFCIADGLTFDMRLITASLDGTCRIYDLASGKLLLTVVGTYGVTSLAIDPALRALYLGLEDGNIRRVDVHLVDKATKTVSSIFDTPTKVYNVPDDPELESTAEFHQPSRVTALRTSFDGTLLVLGDSQGRVMVSDVVTRQVVKSLKSVEGEVTQMEIFLASEEARGISSNKGVYKALPMWNRTLADAGELAGYDVERGVTESVEDCEFEEFLKEVAQEEEEWDAEDGSTGNKEDQGKDLKSEYEDLQRKYANLQKLYGDLFKEHNGE